MYIFFYRKLDSKATLQQTLEMALFLCPISDAPPSDFCRIVIENAKDNWKYRRGKPKKKYQRRVKATDIEQFYELASENSINMGYDETCDTIWFETRAKGDDIVLEGRDTGGQFIRTMIQVAINTGDGRTVDLSPVEMEPFLESQRYVTSKDGRRIRKNGKSCMLVGVQMRMWSMRIGDTVEILGGDPENDDALFWDSHITLFKTLSAVLGVNFNLTKINREDGVAQFKLTRGKNSFPISYKITCDIHTADQILMGLMGLRNKWIQDTKYGGVPHMNTKVVDSPFHRATLLFPKSRDYHPDAMVYALKNFGFLVKDSKPVDADNDAITKWIEKGGMREVWVYC